MLSRKNAIVKYDNNANCFIFGNGKRDVVSSSIVFYALIQKFQNQESDTLILNLSEITQYLKTKKHKTLKDYKAIIDKAGDDIITTSIKINHNENISTRFTIFSEITTDVQEQTIKAVINPSFKKWFFNLESNFTLFDVAEYSYFCSKYSQSLFRLLKQFENTKYVIISIDDFRAKMSIPDTYGMNKITSKVLDVAVNELREPNLFTKNQKPSFYKLQYKKIKSSFNGNRIVSIEFKWEQMPKETKLTHEQNRAIETLDNNSIFKDKFKTLTKLDDDYIQELKSIINHIYINKIININGHIFNKAQLCDISYKDDKICVIFAVDDPSWSSKRYSYLCDKAELNRLIKLSKEP